MTIDAVIEEFIGKARALGWSLEKQNELAVQVVRTMRPEWSDSQVNYSIDMVRAVASTQAADH
jgi:hypothetical protein